MENGNKPLTADEVLIKNLMECYGETTYEKKAWEEFKNEVEYSFFIKAMHEFANQPKPVVSEEEIEKMAMDELKSSWSHLYICNSYPKKPFPTNYENELNKIIIGILKGLTLNQFTQTNKQETK